MRSELRLDEVGRRHGIRGPWVLRGVDLALPPTTPVRIEGTNGTGKSTLLRLLAGIDAPTEGRVTGRPRTAYVPERFPPALPFTAAAYLTHLGTVHGLSRRAATRAAGQGLERLGAAEPRRPGAAARGPARAGGDGLPGTGGRQRTGHRLAGGHRAAAAAAPAGRGRADRRGRVRGGLPAQLARVSLSRPSAGPPATRSAGTW